MTDTARELYSRATTASLTAQLIKRGMRTRGISNIAPVNPNTPRVFGPAYTLRYIPMREDLATGAAMADAPPLPTPHGCGSDTYREYSESDIVKVS